MRQLKFLIITGLFFIEFAASAEIKNWDDILAKATPQEKNNLGHVFQQIRLVPAKDPLTGKPVFKVMAVEKSSVFEREGIQVGDLIVLGSSDNSGTTMELNNTQKTETKKVQKLGFKRGDIIREINGEPVSDPKKTMELYNKIKAGKTATVGRRADGQTQ